MNIRFKAKLDPMLLNNAKYAAKTPEQKTFLAKREKEIAEYGDKNTIISYTRDDGPINNGNRVSLYASNSKLPKRSNFPSLVKTPLFVTNSVANEKGANGYDIVALITPERVKECERQMFIDSAQNKVKAKSLLEQCRGKVAKDTYRTFTQAAKSMKR